MTQIAVTITMESDWLLDPDTKPAEVRMLLGEEAYRTALIKLGASQAHKDGCLGCEHPDCAHANGLKRADA